jgi:hypothetical protein
MRMRDGEYREGYMDALSDLFNEDAKEQAVIGRSKDIDEGTFVRLAMEVQG